LATGQSLKNALLGGVASGAISYLSPDIVKGLGINQGAPINADTSATTGASTGADAGGFDGINVIGRSLTPSFSTSNINLGGFKTPAQKYLDDAANTDAINPETRMPYSSGYDGDLINVTGSVPGAVTGGLNLAGFTADPVVNNTDEIVVSGTRPGAVTGGLDLGSLSPEVIPAIDGLENFPTEADQIAEEDIIKVTGQRPGAVTGGLNLGALTTTAPAVLSNDIVVDATKIEQPASGAFMPTDLGVLDKVSDMETEKKEDIVVDATKRIEPTSVSVVPPTGSVVDTLPPLDLKADPALTDGKKLGVEEYLRLAALAAGLLGGGGGKGQTGYYGGGSGRLNPIFSAKLPAPGGLGTIGATRTQRQLGDVDWLTYGTRPELKFFDYAQPTPAPVTTPVPNDPAAPAMYVPDDNTFARGGGAFAAKRGGRSQRTEFAVSGPGTGRSDDIPAVLSDGEYVIDAETVALLGDGSSKAGAKKLDDLRVKVRKHKGKKLAKGRFSANAKRPEAYLSGGRV
jgi:hypothetical protein